MGRRATVSHHEHLCAGTHNHTKWDFPLLRPRIAIGMDAGISTDVFVGPASPLMKARLLERGRSC
jgi:putative colanic acid biosynthesis acetyltransferase WcaF